MLELHDLTSDDELSTFIKESASHEDDLLLQAVIHEGKNEHIEILINVL